MKLPVSPGRHATLDTRSVSPYAFQAGCSIVAHTGMRPLRFNSGCYPAAVLYLVLPQYDPGARSLI